MKLALLFWFVFLAQSDLFAQNPNCARIIDSLSQTPKAIISKEQKKEISSCIYEIQNEGFLLDEQKCKYDSSKIQIEKALSIWQHINDTPNQANLLKYLGYLNGRLGNFHLGKIQISKAIVLFTSKNIEYGVAVSWFDLAKVYEFENKTDSGLFFTTKALDYWKQKSIGKRIFGLNNYMIHLLTKGKKSKYIDTLISENNLYLLKEKIYWREELDYYFSAFKYFEKIKEQEKKKKFLSLYLLRMSELKKETGQDKYSLFDERNCR